MPSHASGKGMPFREIHDEIQHNTSDITKHRKEAKEPDVLDKELKEDLSTKKLQESQDSEGEDSERRDGNDVKQEYERAESTSNDEVDVLIEDADTYDDEEQNNDPVRGDGEQHVETATDIRDDGVAGQAGTHVDFNVPMDSVLKNNQFWK